MPEASKRVSKTVNKTSATAIFPSLTGQLAALLARPVAQAARARARLHVLDWLGCATLGAQRPAGRAMAGLLREHGAGPCWTLGHGPRPLDAALRYNASLGNILEMDDVHRSSILHPGPVIIPAALAVAQHRGIDDADALLDAIVRGYEATIRIGRAIGVSHYRYWHNTASCGGFGAAAACASLYGLDQAQLVSALGNAGSRSGGLWRMRHEDVMSKQWHTADAAASGVAAAQLAAHGVSGPHAILEGEQGMFAAMSIDADPALVTRAEADWLIFDTTFKPWPACRHAHPAIDALLQLLQRYAVSTSAVRSVRVDTYADALLFCDRPQPRTEAQARFSIQHALAAILAYGAPQLPHYASASLDDANIARWRTSISVHADDGYSTRFPQAYGARVSVTLEQGCVLTLALDDTRGDPACPMTALDIEAKAAMLMDAAGMAPAQAAQLRQAVLALGAGTHLASLWPALSCLDQLERP